MWVSTRLPFWISIAAGFVALAAVSFFYVFFEASKESPSAFIGVYLVLANSILLATLVIVLLINADNRRIRLRQIARLEEKTAAMLQHLDNIFLTRTGVSAYVVKHQNDPRELEACVAQSSDYLRFVVEETRSMFEGQTSHQCAVAIKLLVPPPNGSIPLVKTYLRDQKSELRRRGLYKPDGLYPYTQHSPFVDIVSGKADGNAFVSNDLRAAASQGTYSNGNPFWKKFYNATLIVPIKEPSTIYSENVIGFLCIDSLTAKFDKTTSIYIARMVANTIFSVIYALSILEARRDAAGKQMLPSEEVG